MHKLKTTHRAVTTHPRKYTKHGRFGQPAKAKSVRLRTSTRMRKLMGFR